MTELLKLAQEAAKAEAARVVLLNHLSTVRKQDAFRKAILKKASAEERRIADFARDYSGSDFGVLLCIASRLRDIGNYRNEKT